MTNTTPRTREQAAFEIGTPVVPANPKFTWDEPGVVVGYTDRRKVEVSYVRQGTKRSVAFFAANIRTAD